MPEVKRVGTNRSKYVIMQWRGPYCLKYLCTYVLVLFTITVSAGAEPKLFHQETAAWLDPSSVQVEDTELSFTNKTFKHAITESVYCVSTFNDGWVFMTNYFRVVGDLVNRRGIYVLVTDPEGNTYWKTHEIKKSDFIIRDNQLYVSDGENTIQGDGMSYAVSYDFNDFSCNLFFRNRLPPWKAEDGVVYFDDKEEMFEQRVVNSPWAEVTGTITIVGKEMRVTGHGYSEKSLHVAPITLYQPTMQSMRVFSPRDLGTVSSDGGTEELWSLSLFDFTTLPRFDSKRLSRLFIAKDNEWLLTTPEYSLEPADFVKEEGLPYEYPQTIHVKAHTQGYDLEGAFRSTVLFDFTDILAEVPAVLRAIILLFVDRPVYFRLLGWFEGTLTRPDGTVTKLKLYGPYEYIVVK